MSVDGKVPNLTYYKKIILIFYKVNQFEIYKTKPIFDYSIFVELPQNHSGHVTGLPGCRCEILSYRAPCSLEASTFSWHN